MINFITSNNLIATVNSLQARLDKVNSFHATFIQKVIDSRGNLVQQGYGDLWMKRPNLFNWHMTQPDENILVSDGTTLWFYNPFVNQVTATWLQDITINTPFMLITSNQDRDWQQYSIKQAGNDFILVPKIATGNPKSITINVSNDGTINNFSVIDQNNQRISYRLVSQQNFFVDTYKFTFIPPKNATVDDQRNR